MLKKKLTSHSFIVAVSVRTFFKPAEDLFTIVTQEQLQKVFSNPTKMAFIGI